MYSGQYLCLFVLFLSFLFFLFIYFFFYFFFLLFMSIFTFSKQSLNESLDFCNRSQPHELHKFD